MWVLHCLFKCSDQRVVCEGDRKNEINLEFRIRFLFWFFWIRLRHRVFV